MKLNKGLLFAVAVLAAVFLILPLLGSVTVFAGDVSWHTFATSAPAIATPATAIALSSSALARAGSSTFNAVSISAGTVTSRASHLTIEEALVGSANANSFKTTKIDAIAMANTSRFLGLTITASTTTFGSTAQVVADNPSFDRGWLTIHGGQVADRSEMLSVVPIPADHGVPDSA